MYLDYFTGSEVNDHVIFSIFNKTRTRDHWIVNTSPNQLSYSLFLYYYCTWLAVIRDYVCIKFETNNSSQRTG